MKKQELEAELQKLKANEQYVRSKLQELTFADDTNDICELARYAEMEVACEYEQRVDVEDQLNLINKLLDGVGIPKDVDVIKRVRMLCIMPRRMSNK